MNLEDLALIGNCQCSALISRGGELVWCCLPRFDSEPVFASLLDSEQGGRFAVGAADGRLGVQRYLENTNVVETTFEDDAGAFRVLDFAPRFTLHDSTFRPAQIYRIVEPLRGTPRVRVLCDPHLGWSRARPAALQGSHHVEFEGFASRLRLTTDIPRSYLGGPAFALTERRHRALTWGAPLEEPLRPVCERFLSETVRYWQRWVKQCNIPPRYQREVIRSALALKLHCFEDTGAIVASMTTSIPEAPGSGRTWDYRYCWLRDAYYALGAFRLLGQFEEREQFVHYLLDIATRSRELALSPLYCVNGRCDLDERVLAEWPGFAGERPVRVGNAAAGHTQLDIFGEMVLALTPVFQDDRFSAERSSTTLELVVRLARKAIEVAGRPDAGIWEYRTEWTPQTFSSLMCWAASDRVASIARVHAPVLVREFEDAAARIRDEILARAWNSQLHSFVGQYDGRELDASLLQMPSLRFLPRDDHRLHDTIEAVRTRLTRDGWLQRYDLDDGFGRPTVAFVLCSFWMVEALAATGRDDEARAAMESIHAQLPRLGLLAEDFDPVARRMWGNFPQAYSHVGLIRAAFAASPRWSDVL